MIVGVPKEIKPDESRVGLTPSGALELTKKGHTVYVQAGAGTGSGFPDTDYVSAGALLLDDPAEVYAKADMIIKVKEPIAQEYDLVREGQLIFTYFHFAASEALTLAMVRRGAVCLAYETVELPDRSLPLLVPMSEVAGRMSVQEGAKFLEKPAGGRGILLGGVPGVEPAHVLVLGGGVVGTQAAKMAAGLGADVTLMDVNLDRLRRLAETLPPNVHTVYSNELNIRKALKVSDLVIGAVLIPGAKAPHLVTREMLKEMKAGAVIVDVAVDQGGCVETCKPTTHAHPTFEVEGIVHYCVANIPGAVPCTSTVALTNCTLPFAVQLANKGWKRACVENPALKQGLNVVGGKVVHKKVAEAWNLPHLPVEAVLQPEISSATASLPLSL